jgi:hypothetical protein
MKRRSRTEPRYDSFASDAFRRCVDWTQCVQRRSSPGERATEQASVHAPVDGGDLHVPRNAIADCRDRGPASVRWIAARGFLRAAATTAAERARGSVGWRGRRTGSKSGAARCGAVPMASTTRAAVAAVGAAQALLGARHCALTRRGCRLGRGASRGIVGAVGSRVGGAVGSARGRGCAARSAQGHGQQETSPTKHRARMSFYDHLPTCAAPSTRGQS